MPPITGPEIQALLEEPDFSAGGVGLDVGEVEVDVEEVLEEEDEVVVVIEEEEPRFC